MNKERILDENRRTGAENGGSPLGMDRFEKEAGIGTPAWLGKYWRRWSEAVEEAGFTPNVATRSFERDYLLRLLALLVRELRRFPLNVDIKFAKANGGDYPQAHSFGKLGNRATRIRLLRAYAQAHPEFSDILALLPEDVAAEDDASTEPDEAKGRDGAVYMLKLGKHYKIGKSFRVPQRHREIAIELPEKPDVVHVITTDDPSGMESYWHARFAQKRTNGEWFALSRDDVAAFRRRKFM